MATNFTLSLSCDTQYSIDISAWNEVGESERSRPWIIKTFQSGTFLSISSYNVSRSKEKPEDSLTGEFFGKELIPRYPPT